MVQVHAREKAKQEEQVKKVAELETNNEALERRVTACEKREKAMQGEIDELTDSIGKVAAKAVSKELGSQLTLEVEKLMGQGEMGKKIQESIEKTAGTALVKVKVRGVGGEEKRWGIGGKGASNIPPGLF